MSEEWVEKALKQIESSTRTINPEDLNELIIENIKLPYIHYKIK